MSDVQSRKDGARPLLVALVVAARPKQWLKNVLVFVAPGAAGVLDQPDELVLALVAFLAFCLAASGTYLLNDAADVHADRRHETKRHRPIAAGEVPVGLARVVGAGLLVASVGVAASLVSIELAATVLAYVVLTTSYSTWLKHIAVVDMLAIAAGFMLRAVAGAVATEVPISEWFYIVASAASVFVVAGKRTAELAELGSGAGAHRPALDSYTDSFLTYVRSVSSGVAILAYCLWAFEQAELSVDGATLLQLSIIPFVLGIMRYAMLLDSGQGGAPEEIVLRDRPLQVIGFVWLLVYGIGLYVG